MSIIHDALKRVQQGLAPKPDVAPPSADAAPKESGYLYATPPAVEKLPQAEKQKPPAQFNFKSVLAFLCAAAITTGSAWYLYQQFRYEVPQAERQVKRTFFKLIHQEEVPEFKSKKPEDLKPLAQITLNTPSAPAANGPIAQITVPVTLNVHGIMSNATGNLALINDQVYQEGDEVDGAKILKINLNSITVDISGTEKTIYVKN